VEHNPHRHRRRTAAHYLLTSLLKTPHDHPWFGDGRNGYLPSGAATRPNLKIDRRQPEQAVLDQVTTDLHSPTFIKTLAREALKYRVAYREDPA
jgi:hypothetical protein